MVSESGPPCLSWAHNVLQEWFLRRFELPTEPQEQGWPHILAEEHTDRCADRLRQNARCLPGLY
jgi:hypothetical protein